MLWTLMLLCGLFSAPKAQAAIIQNVNESQVTILKAIKSTGEQAFNTGYTHKANTRIVLDCEVTKNSQRDWEALFGARLNNYRNNAFCFFSRFYNNHSSSVVDAACYNRSGMEGSGNSFIYGERITLECEGKTAKWHSNQNGGTNNLTVVSVTVDDGKTPMFIFDLNTASTEGGLQMDNSRSVMTLYGCKIYEGETLKCDFVPARYNNEVGLYDRVNKTFSGSMTTTAFLAIEYPSGDILADYEHARAIIHDGYYYRIFTMVGTQKYYVTADGRLSTNVADAPLFLFKEVMGTANDREYEYGFQIRNNGYCFTNPYECKVEALTQGHLNYTNKNMRPTWEAQVFFLNTEGKYAIRSTNSPYSSNHENWGWIGSAFWTVNSSASGPVAEYSFDMNYVWQIEKDGESTPTPDVHVHDLEQAGGNPPTCTEWGCEAYWYCTTCNKMFSDDQGHNEISDAPSIPPLGHDLGTRPGVEPTCTKSGRTDATVCKRCGAIYEAAQEIPALGHDFETRPGVEPTCTKSGFTEATVCRRCGEVYQAAQEIPALGHIWGDWVVIREATTTEQGEERRTCQRDESHIETRYVATIVISGLFINETNFPDANFRNILLEKDYGKDGLLTDEEIANITKLYVGGEDIADLTGIEHFTALKELYCFDNQLTTLDVSKNTTLELLSCYNNQLTTLDVSQNTALQTLYCHENQLTTLDVSKNTALQSLSCRENQLTALKVSQNGNIVSISCYSNQLSGAAMDALVESMPVVADGRFRVLNALDANEQNVITKTQVAAVKAKGWSVMRLVGDMGEYEDYEGLDDQPDAIRSVSLTAGNDSWYTLDGVKLSGKPTRKGLYLLNGHKVVVK